MTNRDTQILVTITTKDTPTTAENLAKMVSNCVSSNCSYSWLKGVAADVLDYHPHGAQLSTGYIAKAFVEHGIGYIKDALGVESELEVMDLCCDYGTKADTMLRVKVAEGLEVPGVFDYDVVEPFGEWLAKRICEGHGIHGATEELQRHVDAYFSPTVKKTPEEPCVLLIGNALEGLTVRGPFQSPEEAVEWANDNVKVQDWVIAPLSAA